MSNKQSFIDAIEYALNEGTVLELSTEAREFYESLKTSNKQLTEKGIKILDWLKANHSENKSFTAKEIAEGIFSSSRVVSGSMNKLVNEGYVLKEGRDPVHYIYNIEKENEEN